MLNSLIGIIASSGGAAGGATDYESIATVTLGSASSSISFSSIPSTYQHLQIRALTANSSFPSTSAYLYLNSDTTLANYYQHFLYGDGSSAAAGTGGNTALNPLMGSGMSTGPAATIIDLLDYQDTNKYKTIRLLNGYDTNGGGYVWFASNLWKNTAAVNTFTITAPVGSFNQYSSFALYGIKG